MKHFLFGLLAAAAAAAVFAAMPASADTIVVSDCSIISRTAGQRVPDYVNTAGALCDTQPTSGGTSVAAASTNSSSTITVGGTFQTILAASTARKSFEFQNICNVAGNCNATSDACYLYIAASGSPTTGNSMNLPAGGYYLRSAGSIPGDAVQATCTASGDKFYLAVQ